jgi:hypothetical protein
MAAKSITRKCANNCGRDVEAGRISTLNSVICASCALNRPPLNPKPWVEEHVDSVLNRTGRALGKVCNSIRNVINPPHERKVVKPKFTTRKEAIKARYEILDDELDAWIKFWKVGPPALSTDGLSFIRRVRWAIINGKRFSSINDLYDEKFIKIGQPHVLFHGHTHPQMVSLVKMLRRISTRLGDVKPDIQKAAVKEKKKKEKKVTTKYGTGGYGGGYYQNGTWHSSSSFQSGSDWMKVLETVIDD